jgi:NAD(P)-dependent dehydrogenase (short-subunit alcohol dehydrogenase family)
MNKRVLITGAARGIGYELAKEFLLSGSTVIMTDKDRDVLEKSYTQIQREVLKEIGKSHYTLKGKLYRYRCDVEFVKDIQAVRELIEEQVGGLDILINNAGIPCNKEMAAMDHYEWRRLVNVNLLGPIYHINEFLPMLKKSSGHIVNVSSGQAYFRLPGWGAYAATKVALGAMSEVLAFELSKYDIKVTTVYPFMVNTPFYKEIVGDTFMSQMAMKLIPFYSDSPEKVANKIFTAVQNEKRVEMVNPINRIGQVIRAVPLFADVTTYLSNFFLLKGK